MNSIRGIDNHERLDEELYHDFETDDARKVHYCIVHKPSTNPPHHPNTPFTSPLQKRLARETKELEKLEKTFSQAGSNFNV